MVSTETFGVACHYQQLAVSFMLQNQKTGCSRIWKNKLAAFIMLVSEMDRLLASFVLSIESLEL